MIKSLRIDERLIHGQVAVTWCSALGVDGIVVANDKVANDEVSVMSLKMAAPSNVRVVVKSVEDAIALLLDPRAGKRNILLLVNNPEDALRLVKRIPEIPFVNVGNFGMISSKDDRRVLMTSLAVTQSEIETFREIIACKPESHYQMTPTLSPQRLSDIFKEL